MTGLICLVILLGLGLAATLFLFVSSKSELGKLTKKVANQEAQLQLITDELASDRKRINAQLVELQSHAGVMVPPPPMPSGLNLNKRSQAMRLLRTGTEVETVAVDLQLPRSEIRLLSKVQGILAAAAKTV